MRLLQETSCVSSMAAASRMVRREDGAEEPGGTIEDFQRTGPIPIADKSADVHGHRMLHCRPTADRPARPILVCKTSDQACRPFAFLHEGLQSVRSDDANVGLQHPPYVPRTACPCKARANDGISTDRRFALYDNGESRWSRFGTFAARKSKKVPSGIRRTARKAVAGCGP